MTENPVRHIDTLREMEATKRQYQIRCSHYELELSIKDKMINCTICGKNWVFVEQRGYKDLKDIYSAGRD